MLYKFEGVDIKRHKPESLPYYKRDQKVDSNPKNNIPENDSIITFYLSEFHYYILRNDCITIINLISQKLVEHKLLPKDPDSVVHAISPDGSLIFNVAKERSFYKFSVDAEGNDSWNLQLEKKNFAQAYQLSKKYRPEFSDQIAAVLAQQYFDSKKYKEAAELYSKIQVPFERVVLMFLDKIDEEVEAQTGLINLLRNKLSTLKNQDQTIERTVLVAWLFENVVYRYSQYSNLLEMKKREPALANTIDVNERTVIMYKMLLDEIETAYKDDLDEKTCIQILQSHGRFKECLEFAEKLGKYEEIILNYLNEKDFKNAVERILRYIEILYSEKQRASEGDKKLKDQAIVSMIDFFLKHSKTLILNDEVGYLRILNEMLGKSLFDLIDNNKKIKIVNYLMELQDPRVVVEAKSFLEGLKTQAVESKSSEVDYLKSISNIMIYLLTKIADPKNLEDYLKEKEQKKEIDFDINFAMLLCQQKPELQRCEIMLYGMMELYEEAVSLALKNNQIDLAKLYASKPESKSVKSNLWIKIAKKQMKVGGEVAKLLKENKDELKIEDLIPYFDDNIGISSFREQICDSLTRYNEEITSFKKNMNQYSKNAEFLKKEMSELRNRYYIIDQEKKCDNCGSSIFKDVFYYFPCGHAFLKKCLKDMLRREGLVEKLEKIEYFENGIKDTMKKAEARASARNETLSNKSPYLKKLENLTQDETKLLNDLYEQYDQMLAKECPYCGDETVEWITKPFSGDKGAWDLNLN